MLAHRHLENLAGAVALAHMCTFTAVHMLQRWPARTTQDVLLGHAVASYLTAAGLAYATLSGWSVHVLHVRPRDCFILFAKHLYICLACDVIRQTRASVLWVAAAVQSACSTVFCSQFAVHVTE